MQVGPLDLLDEVLELVRDDLDRVERHVEVDLRDHRAVLMTTDDGAGVEGPIVTQPRVAHADDEAGGLAMRSHCARKVGEKRAMRAISCSSIGEAWRLRGTQRSSSDGAAVAARRTPIRRGAARRAAASATRRRVRRAPARGGRAGKEG